MLRSVTKDLRQKLADGKTMDDALAELRASSTSIIECIAAVRSFRRCELTEAKMVVQSSSAWADVKPGIEESGEATGEDTDEKR